MLVLKFTKKPKQSNSVSMRNTMASWNYYIEYISNSFENKEYIKSIVVLLKCYARFLILFYLRERRMQGRFAESNRPDLDAFPEIGNVGDALAVIIAIAQCQINNTRRDRIKP